MGNQKNLFLGMLLVSLFSLTSCGGGGGGSSNSSIESFNCIFNNYDDTKLYETKVNKGEDVVYGGETPTREKTAQYTYTFSSWDKPLTSITKDTTFTAQFTSKTNQYSVTFKGCDGFDMLDTQTCDYGGSVTYKGETPTKPYTIDYTYTFASIWLTALDGDTVDDLTNVVADRVVYPKFIETIRHPNYVFGSYPQSRLTDHTIITSLNTLAGTLPTKDDSKDWNDYNYYIKGAITSYMWYIDIIKDNIKYRGVYYTSYRPFSPRNESSKDTSYQYISNYLNSTTYWFIYEPITWRVLEENGNNKLLFANINLDSQDYYVTADGTNRVIDEKTIYENNYKESRIRSWLNDSFYTSAFSIEEKEKVLTTTVDNSASSTCYEENQYYCEDTEDKVFLLSKKEATNTSYGMGAEKYMSLTQTEYAICQGIYKTRYTTDTPYYSNWYLRSPTINGSNFVSFGAFDGAVDEGSVDYSFFGVAPAIWVSI